MPAKCPELNSTVSEMIEQLRILSTELDQLMYERNREKNSRSLLPLYTTQDCYILAHQINKLIAAIPTSTSLVKESDAERDAKRILHQTFVTISAPTYENCRALQRIADTVPGYGRPWHQLGMVVVTIVGFIAFIIPGLLYLFDTVVHDWGQYNQKGLSLLTEQMDDAVIATGVRSRVSKRNTFFGSRDDQATEASAPLEIKDDSFGIVSKAP